MRSLYSVRSLRLGIKMNIEAAVGCVLSATGLKHVENAYSGNPTHERLFVSFENKTIYMHMEYLAMGISFGIISPLNEKLASISW